MEIYKCIQGSLPFNGCLHLFYFTVISFIHFISFIFIYEVEVGNFKEQTGCL